MTIRTTRKCTICSRNISRSNYGRHIVACQQKEIDKSIPRPKRTGLNQYHLDLMSGKRQSWNKGLSIKTHPHLRKQLAAGGKALIKKLKDEGKELTIVKFVKSDKGRQRLSELRKKMHIEHPETHPNRRLAGNRTKMSYPERLVFDYLKLMNIDFQHNKKIDRFYPDFIIGNNILEIDGEHWHNQEYDRKRDLILSNYGYIVHRFKVKDIVPLIDRVSNKLMELRII